MDTLLHKVKALGGKVIDEPKTYQEYYGATFADSDEQKAFKVRTLKAV